MPNYTGTNGGIYMTDITAWRLDQEFKRNLDKKDPVIPLMYLNSWPRNHSQESLKLPAY